MYELLFHTIVRAKSQKLNQRLNRHTVLFYTDGNFIQRHTVAETGQQGQRPKVFNPTGATVLVLIMS